MTGELPPDRRNEVSPELKCFLAIARVVFIPAAVLAGICTLGCVAVAIFGELKCSDRALNVNHATRDFLILPVFSVLVLLLVRAMGFPGSELFEKLRSTFELYNIPILEVASAKLTFSMLVFLVTLFGGVIMLCAPIG